MVSRSYSLHTVSPCSTLAPAIAPARVTVTSSAAAAAFAPAIDTAPSPDPAFAVAPLLLPFTPQQLSTIWKEKK